MRLRAIGIAVNVLLRVALVVMAIVVLTAPPGDPRFEDKGIGPRAVLIIGGLSLLIPAWWWLRGRRQRAFPAWTDALWLSVPALDLAGNVFNLYNRFDITDTVTHFHGTGAGTLVAAELLRLPGLSAIGIGQVGHILLEVQEYYGDVAFGLENVHGAADVVNDLLAGLVASLLYVAVYTRLRDRPWVRRK